MLSVYQLGGLFSVELGMSDISLDKLNKWRGTNSAVAKRNFVGCFYGYALLKLDTLSNMFKTIHGIVLWSDIMEITMENPPYIIRSHRAMSIAFFITSVHFFGSWVFYTIYSAQPHCALHHLVTHLHNRVLMIHVLIYIKNSRSVFFILAIWVLTQLI